RWGRGGSIWRRCLRRRRRRNERRCSAGFPACAFCQGCRLESLRYTVSSPGYTPPMSILSVDRRAWRALFAAQVGWMLDAMDFLLFSFAVIPIREEFGLTNGTMGALTSV